MQSLEDKILTKVSKCGRGFIFFSSDFIKIGEYKSISKALERLTNSSAIIRVARGIYCYPKIDKELGLGVLYPSIEDIASAIAKRDKARIAPTGDYALNRLGLSTQVPTNIVFLTDGSPRKVLIYDKHHITFKRVTPKTIAYKNDIVMLLVFALKEIGESNISPEQLEKIKVILKNISKEVISEDLVLMPIWIRNIISNYYE